MQQQWISRNRITKLGGAKSWSFHKIPECQIWQKIRNLFGSVLFNMRLFWGGSTGETRSDQLLSFLHPGVPMGKVYIYIYTSIYTRFSSVQFSQSCPTLCDPMNRSTPGLPVHHQLPEFTQTQVHRVSDAIQPSHPLSSPSSPAPNPSQHQSLFQWVNSSHEVAKVLEFQL